MPNLPVASPVRPATVRLDAALSIFQAPLLIKLRTVVVGKTLTTAAPLLAPAVPELTWPTALLIVVVP